MPAEENRGRHRAGGGFRAELARARRDRGTVPRGMRGGRRRRPGQEPASAAEERRCASDEPARREAALICSHAKGALSAADPRGCSPE